MAGVIAEAFDVLTGHEVSGEHLAEYFKGGFEFFGNDIVGAKRVERPHLSDKARTGDDGDLGIGSTGLDHDSPDGRRVGNDDGYGSGAFDAEAFKDGGLAGVAIGNGQPSPVTVDRLRVHFQNIEGQMAFLCGVGERFA